MTTFMQDTFTGAAGKLLTHVGENGGWTQDPNWNNDPNNAYIDGSDVLYSKGYGATCISNAPAPNVDMFVEAIINTGVVTGGPAYTVELDFWFHYQLNYSPDPGQHSMQLFFRNNQTQMQGNGYVSRTGTYPPYVDAAANGLKVRIESQQSAGQVRLLINDALIDTFSGSDLYNPRKPPQPGLLRLDLFNQSSATGPTQLRIDSIVCGTLGPPPAVWTMNKMATEQTS